jgi:hypothetical protein
MMTRVPEKGVAMTGLCLLVALAMALAVLAAQLH